MSADLSLYLVTDGAHAAAAGHTVPDVVARAVAGGVTTVQVREKHAGARDVLELVRAVADRLRAAPHVTLLVNDRVDVAIAARDAGARVDGVHVGQSDLPAAAARAMLRAAGFARPVVGVSAATPEQLAAAERDGADYVGIGAVHPTATKSDAPAAVGHEGFGPLASATALPAVAIGGVTAADAAPLRAAGAAGIAVVSAVCAAPDPEAAARALRGAFAGVDA
ncbi:thiamine phosphate synthase [Microbacterium petrolearium]